LTEYQDPLNRRFHAQIQVLNEWLICGLFPYLGAIALSKNPTELRSPILTEIIVAVAKQIGRKQIVLAGGCWQNKYLTEKAIALLKQENFVPY
jgi:hydrogenase maturation factor HypF (carbamoyltransferase family)